MVLPVGFTADPSDVEEGPKAEHTTKWWLVIRASLLGILILCYAAIAVEEGRFIVDSTGNVPVSDTFYFIPIFARFAQDGHIPWSWVIAPYGSNRPIFEKLGLLWLARDFAFNVKAIRLASVPLGLFQIVVLIRGFRLALPHSRRGTVWLVGLPAAMVTFSLANWQNLDQEWNLMNTAAVAFALLAILFAATFSSGFWRRPITLIFAALVCAFNSFTGEAGLITWVACCGVLLWPAERQLIKPRLIFLGTAVVFIVVYLHGVPGVSFSYALGRPVDALRFAVTMVGNGVFGEFHNVNELGPAFAIGLGELGAIICVLVAVVRDRRLHREPAALFAIGLILFGLLGAGSTAVDRLSYGIGTAVASRYTVITAPIALGLYIFFVCYWRLLANDKPLLTSTSALQTSALVAACLVGQSLMIATLVSDLDQTRILSARHNYYYVMEYVACFPNRAANSQLALFDNPTGMNDAQKKTVLGDLAALREAHLSLFSSERCREFPKG